MNNGRNVTDLFTDLIERMSTLFRKEVQLAKVEATEKAQQVGNAVAYMAIGGAVLLAALVVLLYAAVAWLVVLGLAIEWSALLVAVVTALIGYLLVHKGLSNIKTANLKPQRTVAQVQRDIGAVREQVQ